MFLPYRKIQRLGKEEVEGILVGKCYIQEKIDGANTSIWMEDGEIKCASRSRELTEGFNGFVDYIKNHEGINKFLTKHPEYRLYGEWLVRHSVSYNETAYKQWYMFDVMVNDEFEQINKVYEIAEKYGIKTPQLFAVLENPSVEDIRPFVGQTNLGEYGEGVVIKNFEFVNKFVNQEYAKWVTDRFKEDNAIIFGGNNKHSDSYWEMYVTNKYCTLERVQKIMNKIQPTIDEKLDMKHIPRITSTVYHDILTEEIWEIAKKVHSINFTVLKRCVMKKSKQIYVDIINNNLSVAYDN